MAANIFIVEDEKPIITLLQYNLEKEGYKVNFSETGEEAIQSIKKKCARSSYFRLDVT